MFNKNTQNWEVKVFKECKCRIYIDNFKKIYSISSMYWEKNHLVAVGYEDPAGEGIVKIIQISEKDILMNFIGKHDKNNNELWEGDLVKFDRCGHGNYIIGVITFDKQSPGFTIDQLTNNKDFINTQDELDEEFKQNCESFKNCLKKSSCYNFNHPENWFDIEFYDDAGASFTYDELEKIGNLYENSDLLPND